MWNWMVGRRKPAHPLDRELENSRTRQRFIAGLSEQTAEDALKAVTQLFQTSGELELQPAVRLQALCELDDFIHSRRGELFGRLMQNAPKQVVCEQTSNLLVQHCDAWAAGYEVVLAALGDTTDPTLHAQRTLAFCRAMRALGKLDMLWRMRYRQAPLLFWTRIESLYAASGARASANASLVLYADEPEESSLLREYLSMLVFEMAPLTRLLPAQVQAADLLLRRYSQEYRLASAFDAAAAPFSIDPAAGVGPQRWVEGLPVKGGTRYFGLGGAYQGILDERQQAKTARLPALWLAPSQISMERYRELLDRLLEHWGPHAPARRQRRDAESTEVLIAHDFGHIRKLVGLSLLAKHGKSSEYESWKLTLLPGTGPRRGAEPVKGQSTDETTPEGALKNLETLEGKLEQNLFETWSLLDSSVDGLGAEAAGKGAWVRVGMLVGYRLAARAEWSLAVVRWITRNGDERVRVGLRKLPGTAFGARVQINDPRQSNAHTPGAPTVHYDAIELDAQPSCVLLAPGVYDPSWHYTLSIGNRWDFVRMNRCIECGLDFESIEFSVTPTPQAS